MKNYLSFLNLSNYVFQLHMLERIECVSSCEYEIECGGKHARSISALECMSWETPRNSCYHGRKRTGWMWHRIGTSEHFNEPSSHNLRRICWLPEQLLASQEELCPIWLSRWNIWLLAENRSQNVPHTLPKCWCLYMLGAGSNSLFPLVWWPSLSEDLSVGLQSVSMRSSSPTNCPKW
jgi:hypothetical protein